MTEPLSSGPPDPEHSDRFTGAAFAAELRQGLARLFRQHPTLGFTLTYLFLTVVGATYEFSVLLRFRINVFQYADPVDFLLAAIRQPLAAASATPRGCGAPCWAPLRASCSCTSPRIRPPT